MLGGQIALTRSLLRRARRITAAPPLSMSSTAPTAAAVAGPSSSVAASTSVNPRWRHHAAALLGKRAGARLALRLGVRANSMANLAAKAAPSSPSEAKWAYGQELLDYYSKCYLPAMRAQIAALVDLQRQTALRSTTEQLARDILPPGVSARAAARMPMMIPVPLTTGLSPVSVESSAAAAAEEEEAAVVVAATADATVAADAAGAASVDTANVLHKKKKKKKKKGKGPGETQASLSPSGGASATGVPPLTQEQLDAVSDADVGWFQKLLVPKIKACRTARFRQGLLGNKAAFMADRGVSAQGVLDYLRPLCVAGEWRAACDVFWRGQQLGQLVPASYLLCIYAASMDGNEKLAMTACVV
jgi:hypothetical protein